MDEPKVRKRGRPRRGPFSGDRITWTTKLTKETMDRLTASASASGMSASQKGEAALVRGLNAEDDFAMRFVPALRSFEDQMTAQMPPRDGSVDLEEWAANADAMVQALCDALLRAIKVVRSSGEASSEQPHASGPTPSSPLPPSPVGQLRRRLDVED